jgi:hypothetical protein
MVRPIRLYVADWVSAGLQNKQPGKKNLFAKRVITVNIERGKRENCFDVTCITAVRAYAFYC